MLNIRDEIVISDSSTKQCLSERAGQYCFHSYKVPVKAPVGDVSMVYKDRGGQRGVGVKDGGLDEAYRFYISPSSAHPDPAKRP